MLFRLLLHNSLEKIFRQNKPFLSNTLYRLKNYSCVLSDFKKLFLFVLYMGVIKTQNFTLILNPLKYLRKKFRTIRSYLSSNCRKLQSISICYLCKMASSAKIICHFFWILTGCFWLTSLPFLAFCYPFSGLMAHFSPFLDEWTVQRLLTFISVPFK